MDIEAEARRLYSENDDEGLFRLAAESWPAKGELVPPGVGEACRFAFIRARGRKLSIESQLYEARALTAAVLTDAKHTMAGMLLPHVFRALEIGARPPGDGRHRAAEAARDILEELKRLAEPTRAWGGVFERLYHDKRAVTFLMQGTDHEGRPLPDADGLLRRAEASYLDAQKVVQGKRDTLKVRGGVALVRYLLADEVDAKRRCELASETEDIRDEAQRLEFTDVQEWAKTNAAVMRRGEFTGWTPYEVL